MHCDSPESQKISIWELLRRPKKTSTMKIEEKTQNVVPNILTLRDRENPVLNNDRIKNYPNKTEPPLSYCADIENELIYLNAQALFPLKGRKKLCYECMICGFCVGNTQKALRHTKSLQHDQLYKIKKLSSARKMITYNEKSEEALNGFVEKVFGEARAGDAELEEGKEMAKKIALTVLTTEPDAKFQLFGSISYACGLKSCDVNVNISHPDPSSFIPALITALKSVTQKGVGSVKVRLETTGASLSHILCHFESSLVRIYFNEEASCNTCQLIKHYFSLDKRVLPLVIFLKAWARHCRMDDPDNEGLPSYIFIILTIFFLQRPPQQPPVLPILHEMVEENGEGDGGGGVLERILRVQWQSKNRTACGPLLEQMLAFYCFQFDFEKFVISINSSTMLRQKEENTKRWMAVEDPFVVSSKVMYYIACRTTRNYMVLKLMQLHNYLQNLTSCLQPGEFPVTKPEHHCSLATTLTSLFAAIQPAQWPPVLYEKNDVVVSDMMLPASINLSPPHHLKPLDDSLYAVSVSSALSPQDLLTRTQVMQKIASILSSRRAPNINFSDCKLHLFGSSINGFWCKDSDLDFMLDIDGPSQQKVLESVYQCFKRLKAFSDVKFISKTKIPVVKMTHVASRKECDISCCNELALVNSRLLKTYSSVDDRCIILGHALKRLTKMADIADASQGSLSSYSYLIMLIFFLQRTSPPVLPCLQAWHEGTKPVRMVDTHNVWFFEDLDEIKKKWKSTNSKTPGELWLELLHFYACKFDYDLMVVSISQVEALSKFGSKCFKSTLAIQDPFEVSRNIGRVLTPMNALLMRRIFMAVYQFQTTAIFQTFNDPRLRNIIVEERKFVYNLQNLQQNDPQQQQPQQRHLQQQNLQQQQQKIQQKPQQQQQKQQQRLQQQHPQQKNLQKQQQKPQQQQQQKPQLHLQQQQYRLQQQQKPQQQQKQKPQQHLQQQQQQQQNQRLQQQQIPQQQHLEQQNLQQQQQKPQQHLQQQQQQKQKPQQHLQQQQQQQKPQKQQNQRLQQQKKPQQQHPEQQNLQQQRQKPQQQQHPQQLLQQSQRLNVQNPQEQMKQSMHQMLMRQEQYKQHMLQYLREKSSKQHPQTPQQSSPQHLQPPQQLKYPPNHLQQQPQQTKNNQQHPLNQLLQKQPSSSVLLQYHRQYSSQNIQPTRIFYNSKVQETNNIRKVYH